MSGKRWAAGRTLAMLALAVTAGWVRPAFAASVEIGQAAREPSAGDSIRPTPSAMESLRGRVGSHPLRVWTAQDSYDFRRVRLEATGVAFRERDRVDYRAWSADTLERPLASPVPWNSIVRVETRYSYAGIGAVAGMVVGGLWLASAMSNSPEWEDLTGGVATVGVFIVLPGLLGLTIGSAIPHWRPAWERPGAPAKADE